MKKLPLGFIALVLLLAGLVCFTSSKETANSNALINSGKAFKVKGLYLGMSMDDARVQVAKLFNVEAPEVEKGILEGECVIASFNKSGNFLYALTANIGDMKVNRISLGPEVFNASDNMDFKVFVKAFMDAYGIREMKLGVEKGVYGGFFEIPAYVFESPEGYQVSITDNPRAVIIKKIYKKSLIIEKTAKSDLKFD
jgi:hypothetical protein